MKTFVLILVFFVCAAGNLLSQPYYYNSGDPTVLSNWGNLPGGTGAAPGSFGEVTSYIIESGKTATVNSPWNFQSVILTLRINPGATLIANEPVSLIGNIFQLDSGATYVHNNTAIAGTTVFYSLERFNQYSTVRIDKWSSLSDGVLSGVTTTNGYYFGNLEINWSGCGGDWYQNLGVANLCANDLRITNTGKGRFLPGSTGSYTSFTVKNYIQTGGEVDFAFGFTNTGYATTMSIQGNFEKTGGVLDANGAQAFGQIDFARGNIYGFNNNIYQNFTNSGTLRRVRFSISNYSLVKLLSDIPLSTNNTLCGIIFGQYSKLDCGEFQITGIGPLNMNTNYATLKLGSPFGYKTGSSSGNIITTGTKTFTSTDTIEYNGTSAQVLGDSLPFNFPAVLKTNNPNDITLNKSLRFGSQVKFVNGKINMGNYDFISTALYFPGSAGISETRFFNTNGTGYYKEFLPFGGEKYFFVGNGTMSPVKLQLGLSSADTFAFRVTNGFTNLPKDSSKCVRKTWSIVESTPGGSQAIVSLQWNQAEANGTNFNLNSGVLGMWDPVQTKYIPTRSYLIYPFAPPAFPASIAYNTNNTYIYTFAAGQDFIVGNEEGIYKLFYYNSGDAAELSSWKENLDGTGLSPDTFDDYTFFRVGDNKNAVFNTPAVFGSGTVFQGDVNSQITSNAPIYNYGAFELWGNAVYNHNNTIPAYYSVFAGKEYFDRGSTYNILMWSDTAQKIYDGVSATFGNLTINFNNLNGGFGGAQWKGNYNLRLCNGNLKLIQCSGYYFCAVGNQTYSTTAYIGGNLIVGDSTIFTYPVFDLSGGSSIPVGQQGPRLLIEGNVDIQAGTVLSQSYPVIQKGSIRFYHNSEGKKHTFYCYRPFLFQTFDIGDSVNPNMVYAGDTLVLKSNIYNAQVSGFIFKDKWRIEGVLDIDTFSISSVNIEIASGGKLITRNRNGIDASLSSQKITFEGGSTLEYAGNETQTFVNAANYHLLNVANLVINNPNNVIMNIPDVTIHDNLTFLNGSLITDSVNYPTFADTAGILTSGSSSINGPVRIFTSPFKMWSFYLSNQGASRYFTLQAVDFSEWKVQFHNSPQPYGITLGTGINSISQNEYFTVERLSGTSSATIALGWGRNTGITNPNNLRVAHWNGSMWEDTGNNGWSGDNDSGFVFSNFTSNFSPFVIGSVDEQPLPVELSSFTAAINKNNVMLSWTTNNESNNSGFEIQRRTGADTIWKKVSFVQGAGNSNSQINYKYEDKNISTGKYFYRLKQTDHNGNFTYYKLQNEVNVGVPVKFNLSQNYPNPFNPATKINFDLPSDAKVQLSIYDITGRLMAAVINNENFTAGYHTVQFNGSSLASGTYFYRITAGEFVQTKKMTLVK